MAEDPITTVARQLRLRPGCRDQVIRELHSHIQASRHDLELAGRTPEDAARESVRRFGDPAEVAELLTAVHRRRLPRVQSLMAALVALMALTAWLGTSHTFASSAREQHHSRSRQASVCHLPVSQRLLDAMRPRYEQHERRATDC